MYVLFFVEEFVAHGSNVNCLALGHKSGRVMVTGGEDKKVNMWAVGKPNCIMVGIKIIALLFIFPSVWECWCGYIFVVLFINFMWKGFDSQVLVERDLVVL